MEEEEIKIEKVEQLYEVERILDRKKIKGKYKYLIKWKGYSMKECTWEPLSSLENIKDYVEQFDAAIDNDKFIKEEEVKEENKENEDIDNKNNKSSKEKTKTNNKGFIKKKRKLSEEEITTKDNKENNLINEEKDKKIIEIDESFKKIIGIRMENNELIAVVERKVNNKNKEEMISTKKLKDLNPLILIDYYEKRINFE